LTERAGEKAAADVRRRKTEKPIAAPAVVLLLVLLPVLGESLADPAKGARTRTKDEEKTQRAVRDI
jgi:hypothetical protein